MKVALAAVVALGALGAAHADAHDEDGWGKWGHGWHHRDPYSSSLDSFVAMYKVQHECFGDYWHLCRRPHPKTTTTLPATTFPGNETNVTTLPNETLPETLPNETLPTETLPPIDDTTTAEGARAHMAAQSAATEALERAAMVLHDESKRRDAAFAPQYRPSAPHAAKPSWSMEKCLQQPEALFAIENSKCRDYMSGVRACVSAIEGIAQWWVAVMTNESSTPTNFTTIAPNATEPEVNATTLEPVNGTTAPAPTNIFEWIEMMFNMSAVAQEAEIALDEACSLVLARFGNATLAKEYSDAHQESEHWVSEEDRFTFCVLRVHSRIRLLERLLWAGCKEEHGEWWNESHHNASECHDDDNETHSDWNETRPDWNETRPECNVTRPECNASLPFNLSLAPYIDERDFDECAHSDFFKGIRSLVFLWKDLTAWRWDEPHWPTTIAPTDVNGSTIPAPTPSPLDAAVMAWKGWRPEGEEASEEPHEEPGYAPLPIQTAMYIASVIGDAIAQMEQALAALQDVLGLMRGW